MNSIGKSRSELISEVQRLQKKIEQLEYKHDNNHVNEKNSAPSWQNPDVYRVLTSTLMDGFWIISLDGKLQAVNDIYCQIIGYSVDELLEKSIVDIDVNENIEDVQQHIQVVVDYGADRFETQHRCKDGRIIDVEVSATYLPNDRCLLAFLRDITAEKHHVEELRSAKEYAEDLIQRINAIVVGLNSSGEITIFNQVAEGLTGYTATEIRGQNWFDFIVPKDRYPHIWDDFECLRIGGMSHNIAYPILTKSGDERHIVWQNNIVYENNQITGIISSGIDITEHKRTEALLRARLELSEYAVKATADELYQKTLDEAERLTASKIGFFHLLEKNQNILQLQMWSTNTLENMCQADGKGQHYPVNQAGVWVDCIHQRQPVIHNDYASLPHQKGLPLGHAPVIRELVIPIMQGDSIVAILGVGNKETLYTDSDVEIVTQLGNMAWDIIQRKLVEDAEHKQRILATTLTETAEVINSTLDFEEVLRRILISVDKVIPHHGTNIMLLNEDQSQAQIVHYCNCYAKYGLEHPSLHMKWDVSKITHLQKMVETGIPLVIPNVAEYPSWVSNSGNYPIACYVGAPIINDGQVIGLLNVDNTAAYYYDETHAEQLKAFATQAAIAIKNARMFQKLSSYNVDLEEAVFKRTQEITQVNHELEKLSHAKDEFVSNVSHELRTPITNLLLRSYLLRKSPEQLDKHLSVIERETRRLEHIIEDLLRLSRLDQNHIDLNIEKVNLNNLISQVTSDRALEAAQMDIALLYKGHAENPIVELDEGLIIQLVNILLTNAMNYSASGKQIIVHTQNKTHNNQLWAEFSVKDLGLGIASQDIDHIFDRFYRGEGGRQSQAPGTGLGLAIAKKIIDEHGGQIFVESTGISGEGSIFTVRLPVERLSLK